MRQAASFRTFCFLRDTEDSQIGENCSHQGVKEQRQRQEFLWHMWAEDDRTNVTELKIA